MKKVFLSVGIMCLIFVFGGQSIYAAWWDYDWEKKREIAVQENAGSNLTDYSVLLNIAYDPDMQNNFDDLRFLNLVEDTELSYWIESKTDGESALIWVKVPSLTGSATTSIYMYYGNSGASSQSNAEDVFIYYEDFSTDVFLAGWTRSDSSRVYVEDGLLKLPNIGTNDDWCSYLPDDIVNIDSNGIIIEQRTKIDGAGGGGYYLGGHKIYFNGTTSIVIVGVFLPGSTYGWNYYSNWNGDSKGFSSSDNGIWGILKTKHTSTTGIQYFKRESDLNFTEIQTRSLSLTKLSGVKYRQSWDINMTIDWIRVYKTCSTDPTYTIESEEDAPQILGISVTPGIWEVGRVRMGGAATSGADGSWNSFTAWNSGTNVTADFKVTVEDSGHWMFETDPGDEKFAMDLTTAGADTGWNEIDKTGGYQFANEVSEGGTQTFDLKVHIPTTTTFLDQTESVTIMLEASEYVPPWVVNEANCNALSGWHWYTTNGRSACWSKALAYAVSWNKGVGNDTDNPGVYTAATGYTLQERMAAAAAGEWYKIVSNVNGTAITSSHNGAAGNSVISALAIADCLDGTRDLCSTNGCLGSSWSSINTSLRAWAGAAGKSAIPYLATDAGTSQSDNDFWDACSQYSSNDLPLGCTDGLFYKNRKVCGDGEMNYCWAAACGSPSGYNWAPGARLLGNTNGCSYQNVSYCVEVPSAYHAFRVVVRP